MNPIERINQVGQACEHDPPTMQLLRELCLKATAYVTAVATMQSHILTDGVETISELDQRRTIAHNALIDALNIANRRIRNVLPPDSIPSGGAYSNNPADLATPQNRAAIGDWAGELVCQMFQGRRR